MFLDTHILHIHNIRMFAPIVTSMSGICCTNKGWKGTNASDPSGVTKDPSSEEDSR